MNFLIQLEKVIIMEKPEILSISLRDSEVLNGSVEHHPQGVVEVVPLIKYLPVVDHF